MDGDGDDRLKMPDVCEKPLPQGVLPPYGHHIAFLGPDPIDASNLRAARAPLPLIALVAGLPRLLPPVLILLASPAIFIFLPSHFSPLLEVRFRPRGDIASPPTASIRAIEGQLACQPRASMPQSRARPSPAPLVTCVSSPPACGTTTPRRRRPGNIPRRPGTREPHPSLAPRPGASVFDSPGERGRWK